MKIKVWLKGGFGNTLFQITHALAIHYATRKNVVLASNLTQNNVITKILNWTIHEPLYVHLIESSNMPLSIERISLAQSIYIYVKAFISRKKKRNISGTLYSNYSDILNIQSGLKNHLGYFQQSDCHLGRQSQLHCCHHPSNLSAPHPMSSPHHFPAEQRRNIHYL